MAEQLGVAPSALSFHLKELAHAGLVSSEPRGRHLIYRASFGQMNALLAYLTRALLRRRRLRSDRRHLQHLLSARHEPGRHPQPGLPVPHAERR
jgi:DNA-binding transcriptional ArsR family regulator